LTLLDGDDYAPINRERQSFRTLGNKAKVQAEELRTMFSDERLQISAVPSFVEQTNIKALIEEGDLVLVCPDNHPTRRLVISRCTELHRSVVISGGNDLVTGDAQLQVIWGGTPGTPLILDYCPAIARAEGVIHAEGGACENAPEQFFVTNKMATMSMLLLLNALVDAWSSGRLAPDFQEICFDVEQGKMTPRALRPKVAKRT
jgi:hypothetical protein